MFRVDLTSFQASRCACKSHISKISEVDGWKGAYLLSNPHHYQPNENALLASLNSGTDDTTQSNEQSGCVRHPVFCCFFPALEIEVWDVDYQIRE